MTENPRTAQAGLDHTVSRVAVMVQEKHPRPDELPEGVEAERTAVVRVKRPYWARQGAGAYSLAGGKIEDGDFPEDIAGVELSHEEMIHIARRAAARELIAELGIRVELEDLQFVGLFDNGPWSTVLFALLAEKRPQITIGEKLDTEDEIDGYDWENAKDAVTLPSTFADHGRMIHAALELINAEPAA